MTFADFWGIYPRKTAKKDAEKAWNQALKSGASPEAIMEHLSVSLTEWAGRDLTYIPYPASWLRAEAFEEERTEALEDEEPTLFSAIPEPCFHWCYAHRHHWDCGDATCIYPTHYPCPRVEVEK